MLTNVSARQMMGEDEFEAEVVAEREADGSAVTVEELEAAEDVAEDGLEMVALRRAPSSGADTFEQMLYNVEDDEDENCWTRGITARCCTPRYFAFFLCLYVTVQSMMVTGLFSSSLSSIERRYGLSSFTTGLMASTYDFTFLLFATAVGYHGGRGHVPRWLGVGAVVLVAGALVFVSPEFFGDEYQAARYFAFFCFSSNQEDPSVCTETIDVVWLFFFGMALLAMGSTPLYTLAPAYLDNVVKHKVLSVYLGFFYACAALGPALGFGLGYVFLGVWVDPGQEPDDIDEEDPYWVGAWWVGYAIAALVAIWCAVPLLMYPKWLPNTGDVRARNRKQHRLLQGLIVRQRASEEEEASRASGDSASASAAAPAARPAGPVRGPSTDPEEAEVARDYWLSKSFRRSVRGALSNRPFMFNAFGQACEAFAVTGFAAFLPKAGETVFRLTASEASLRIGLVLIPGAAGGIFFGGWLMRRVKATALTAARYTVVIALASILLLPALLVGCDTLPLAGVTRAYPAGAGGSASSIVAECNADCRCDPDRYKPVCGSDGLNYFSACHAGCDTEPQLCGDPAHASELSCAALATCEWTGTACVRGANFSSGGDYYRCGCVGEEAAAGDAPPLTFVTDGRCDKGCNAINLFLVLLFFLMFLTFMNNVPATTVILRVLKFDQRAVGLGVQNVVFRLVGSIPGPIVFGLVLDGVCVLRTEECGKEVGSCSEYDTWDLRLAFFGLALAAKVLSALFFYLSYRAMQRPEADRRRGSVFQAMDRDRSETVTRGEIIDFLRLECFLGNTLFEDHASLSSLADEVLRIVDTNGDGQIQRRELDAWISSLPLEQQREVRGAVTEVTDARRQAAIERVFQALDTNNDNRVSRDEVLYWLRHEAAWQAKTAELMRDGLFQEESAEQVRADLLREIDSWEDDNITRDELENFFSSWTVRDMQLFTEDQRFYTHLQRHASGDDEEYLDEAPDGVDPAEVKDH